MMQVRRPREESSPPPPWTELPHEITANILYRIGAAEVLDSAQKVCTTWRSVCMDPDMWRVIDMLNVSDRFDIRELEIMCRRAVDRSQGLLVAISVGFYIDDDLLGYIAERSGKLRRLRFDTFMWVSCDGLIEAVKRLPLLEELVVDMILVLDFNACIEIVGHSCPLLTSFGLNNDDTKFGGKDDYVKNNEDAFAIARSMPELRQLQLRGNGLTNEGLEAIVDGCPHLESIDLENCYHVKLKGDLGKRLATQLKSIKYPTPEYELQEEEYESFDEEYDW